MPQQRNFLLLISAACFAMIGVALYLQHYHDRLPCGLCVVQRYALLATGLLCMVAASAKKPRVWGVLALATLLGGVGTVVKHLYVLAHPGLSCGIDPVETFLNKVPTSTYLPWIFRAEGLCEDARDKILGLSIPQWSAVGFGILTIALIMALLRRR